MAMNYSFFKIVLSTLLLSVYFPINSQTLILDINEGNKDSNPRNFFEYNGEILFSAEDGDHGEELYVYNYDTLIRYEICSGPCDSRPSQFTVFKDELYFVAFNGWSGRELWKYNDGNPEQVLDIAPGSTSSDILIYEEVNSYLYFSANDDLHGAELWRFDGEEAERLTDLRPGGESGIIYQQVIGYNSEVIFTGYSPELGNELFKFDGDTVQLVMDIYEGGAHSAPIYFTRFQDALYFRAADGRGKELWKYNGETLSLVKDINPIGSSSPMNFYIHQDTLYFNAEGKSEGMELWKTDGDTVMLVQDIYPGLFDSDPRHMTSFQSDLYFRAWDYESGIELLKYNGDSITVVEDINPLGHSYPTELTVVGNLLYFQAFTDTVGEELFVYDGNTVETFDFNPGIQSASPQSMEAINCQLFLAMNHPVYGNEPFIIDVDQTSSSLIDTVVCGEYSGPDGQIFNKSGNYQAIIPNSVGCDSVISINLTITEIDKTVIQDGDILTAMEDDASYQWVDCDNDFQPIAGETNISYLPEESGNYTVEITKNNCTEVSECINVTVVGSSLKSNEHQIVVYPSPSKNYVTVDFGKINGNTLIFVRDISGSTLGFESIKNKSSHKINLPEKQGVYLIEIINDKRLIKTLKVLKN